MRCFIDMDGVLADYDRLCRDLGITAEKGVEHPGAFLNLAPIPGAIEAVPQIMALGYDVYIASKPAPSWPMTYHDKAEWVIRTFPMLKKKLILTQNKGLLGSRGDALIDDRPHKANCIEFPGYIIHFGGECAPATPARVDRYFWVPDWPSTVQALSFLRG